MIFNTLHDGEAKMNQRGAEYPAWLAIGLAAGAKNYVEVGCGVGRGCIFAREAGFETVIGIDLCPHAPSIWREERPTDSNLLYIPGDSSSDEVIGKTLILLGEKPDAVFIDADHSYEKSKMDFEKWWPHVRLACGFHDILMDNPDTVGPFWKQVRLDYRSLELFSRDRKSVLEWQGPGALAASPDGWITGAGIGILFKE